jgi:hypothetical protein
VLGAAPRTRLCATVILTVAAATFMSTSLARATVHRSSSTQTTKRLWAMELAGSNSALQQALFKRFAADGINAIVTSRLGWSTPRHRTLVRLTRATGMRLIEPTGQPKKAAGLRALRAACRSAVAGADRCAVLVPDAAAARHWMRLASVRFVVLRVSSPRAFAQLRLKSTKATRLIGVVSLPKNPPVSAAWGTAVAAAAADGPDLAVTSGGGTSGPALNSYLGMLRAGKKASTAAAAVPATPSSPTDLVLIASGESYLTVGWSPSKDDVGVAGYEFYVNGSAAGATQ